MLEQYAADISLTELDVVNFCMSVLKDKGFSVVKKGESGLQTPEPGKHYEQFRADMAAAGFKVSEYRGRYFWKGPAVFTNARRGPNKDAIVRATLVPLQYDSMGFDYVVYPKAVEETWR